MTVPDDDPVLRLLERLPAATPDAVRTERTQARCHQLAARQARSLARRAELGSAIRRGLEPAVVAGFSVTYVIALVHTLLRWHGVL